jgi:uncharacterized RDD family membrane protein YckC
MEQHYNQTTDLFLEEPVIYGGFVAALIDGIILLIPNLALTYLVPQEIAGSILSIIMYWLYYAVQESGTSQATFGKKIVGLKITAENGERVTFGQASGRYFGRLLSTITLFIGYFMMLWDKKRQTLHDKMAGTLVVMAQ